MGIPNFLVRIRGRDANTKEPVHATGFLVTKNGHVATCLHVVDGIENLTVSIPYTEPWQYRVATSNGKPTIDRKRDLAILEPIAPPNVPTPFASLSKVPLDTLYGKTLDCYGDSAEEHFTTAQLRRYTISGFSPERGMIGIDGNVNPGDSGGPMLDDANGVVAVIRVRDRKRAGQGMGVPSRLLADLIVKATNGEVAETRERLGDKPDAEVWNLLRTVPRPLFERVVMLLGIDEDDLPPFSTGQDQRANKIATLVAAGEISADRVRRTEARARATLGFGRVIRDGLWTLLARFWNGLYETLATRGAVREPEERRPIQEYHEDLVRRMELDSSVQLIEQDVIYDSSKSGAFDADVPRGTAVRRIRHLLKQLSGLSRGGDQSSAQLASLSRRSKIVRDAVATLFHSQRPVILLGEPGSGKSMTLREVAREMVIRKCRGPRPPLVVFARLGAYTSVVGAGTGDIVDFIRSQIPAGFQAVRDAVPVLIEERRLIVLFDGMDEMERKRYNQRVQELSRFASEYEKEVRTLFSCRINDFTTDFQHRQLVLLPFEESQIAEFVRRNVKMPVTVDEVTYQRPGELVRDLRTQAGLADLINNPLMLYLTCQYIHSKRSWPATRAELFASYVEQHLVDMAEKRRLQLMVDEPASLLDGWARIAIELFKHKRGDVAIETLAAEHPNAERVVDVGLRAGILQTDADDESRIRFAHHRYQEYFAARFLAQPDGEKGIDWSHALDIPAWQETLLNLASLNPQCRALVELERSLSAPLVQELPDEPWPVDAHEERLWTDRIVLASHIVRESVAQKTSLPATFEESFRTALGAAARTGRPTSQVKMLWAWKNAPGASVTDALAVPLASTIGWVRNQAILLVAAVSRVDLTRNLGIDLSIDLASEMVLRRIGTYVRAARSSGRRWLVVTLWAALCQVLFWIAMLSAAVTAIVWTAVNASYKNPRLLNDPWTAVIILSGAVCGLVPLFRSNTSFGLGRSAIGSTYVLASVWFLIWGMVQINVLMVFGVGFAVMGLLFVPVLVVELCFWGFAFTYLMLLQVATNRQTRQTAARLMWASQAGSETRDLLGVYKSFLNPGQVIFYVLMIVVSAAWPRIRPWLNSIGIARILEGLFDAIVWIIGGFWILVIVGLLVMKAFDGHKLWQRILAGLVLSTAIVCGVVWFIPSGRALLILWKTAIVAFLIAAGGILALVLGLILILAVLCAIGYTYMPWFISMWHGVRMNVTKEWWISRIRSDADPVIQFRLLQMDRSRFTPRVVSAAEYLEMLIAIEKVITAEPAAGYYWRKRQEIEQAVRHESQ
ncbi:MAG TPA: trypsin-like peptidase domain-containing protein [Thermoanaerobaculia bacterium]|nr:trypsin-like peptidase domain-containing protein [Thermoanaerobaculia bacterium]